METLSMVACGAVLFTAIYSLMGMLMRGSQVAGPEAGVSPRPLLQTVIERNEQAIPHS